MSYRVEICTRKHFTTQLVIDQHRKINSLVTKIVEETTDPLWQTASKQNEVGRAQGQAVGLEDHLSFVVSCVTKACNLTHFFTHHHSYFAVKWMRSRGKFLSGFVRGNFVYSCDIVSGIRS